MRDKIEKPREFTDAEAEAFARYLTQTEIWRVKYRKRARRTIKNVRFTAEE